MSASCFIISAAQNHVIYDNRIATLQVIANDDWMSLPIIELNTSDVINIGFDDFTHEYTRYTYKIEHCEADWSLSESLFPSDYITGFTDGNTIDDSEESINTNVLYTHYSLQIPNSDCRLKMSGNYKITVYDENDDDRPMFTACFMVLQKQATVSMSVSTNTDMSVNNKHQQVSMQLSYGNLRVIDPETQIKTVVMQNRRWDNCRVNAQPQYKMYDGLRWHHCRDYIFNAGNEYRKYEILDVDHPTMGVDYIDWDGENYHVYPFTDEPRKNYVYDEDADGAFLIRNSDNYNNDYMCEYVYVHYRLKTPHLLDSRVFLGGDFTGGLMSSQFELVYNFKEEMYEAVVFQKQGYYNYQYLVVNSNGLTVTPPFDGDYYQTENSYQALIYYRAQGDRADRLVGYCEVQIN